MLGVGCEHPEYGTGAGTGKRQVRGGYGGTGGCGCGRQSVVDAV